LLAGVDASLAGKFDRGPPSFRQGRCLAETTTRDLRLYCVRCVLFLILAVSGCLAQTPEITAVSPSSVPGGSPAFSLSLTGTNFCGGSKVSWITTAQPPVNYTLSSSYASNTLTAAVPATLVAVPAVATLYVINGPGVCGTGLGGVSAAVSFVVSAVSSTPNPAIVLKPQVLYAGTVQGSKTKLRAGISYRNVNGTPTTKPLNGDDFSVTGGEWLAVDAQSAADIASGTLWIEMDPTNLTTGSYLGYVVYPGLNPLSGGSAGVVFGPSSSKPRDTASTCNQVSTAVVFTIGNPGLSVSPLNPVLTPGQNMVNMTVNSISGLGSDTPLPMQIIASTDDGSGAPCWLSIPLNTPLQTGSPFAVTATGTNTAAGLYFGGISVQAGSSAASNVVVFQNVSGSQTLDVGGNQTLTVNDGTNIGMLHVAAIPDSPSLPITVTCGGCAGASLAASCSGCGAGAAGQTTITGMTPMDLTLTVTDASRFVPGQALLNITSAGAPSVSVPITVSDPSSDDPPVITYLRDAAGFGPVLVPGEWAAIFGNSLSATTRPWASTDFTNGTVLPINLSGVRVTFGGIPAPVYYISPGQINVQVPAGVIGSVPVVVTSPAGLTSPAVNAAVAANGPAIYSYQAGSNIYAVATHANGTLIGDPAVEPTATKAKAGETIVIYVNGLAASPSGTILGAIPYTASPVTVSFNTASFNSTPVTAGYAGVAFAGGFQVNVTVPAGLTAGNYAVSVSTLGKSSQTGVILPVGP